MDSFLPYNIKSDDCPQDPGGSRAEADQLSFDFDLPWHIGGSPFTVHGKVCHIEPGGLAFTRKKKMREVEGRGSQGVKRKSEGQARGKSTAAGSSKRHFRLGGICGRPHYERMQVMQRNLTTASVNYNSK